MKFKRIPVRTLPSGNEISIPVYFFEGKNPSAKSVYFQSSIHGAELQGNAVIFQLIEYFKKNPPLGNVTLVPCANPMGMDRKTGEYTDGRNDPTTGENFNRAYFMPVCESEKDKRDIHQIALDSLPPGLSYSELKARVLAAVRAKKKHPHRFAHRLALTLQELAVQADLVLDLHNANISVPYLYAFEDAVSDALYLGAPFIISMPPKFDGALDEAFFSPWAMLAKKFSIPASVMPQSFTLELGNQEEVSNELASKQVAGILEYLRHQGVVKGSAKKPKAAIVGKLSDYRTVYAKRGGLYEFTHPLGKPIQKSKTLAYCLNFTPSGGVREPVVAGANFLPILRYSSSEVSVALTVDETALGSSGKSVKDHTEMLDELRAFADVKIEEDLSLVAIIGNSLNHASGVAAKVFQSISEFNVRLICHGASEHNICFLVSSNEAPEVAKRLHHVCIEWSSR